MKKIIVFLLSGILLASCSHQVTDNGKSVTVAIKGNVKQIVRIETYIDSISSRFPQFLKGALFLISRA